MPVSTVTPERSFSTVSQDLSTGNHEDRATLSSCSNAHVQGQRLTGRPWLRVLRQEQDAKLRLPIKLDLRYLAGHSDQYNSL